MKLTAISHCWEWEIFLYLGNSLRIQCNKTICITLELKNKEINTSKSKIIISFEKIIKANNVFVYVYFVRVKTSNWREPSSNMISGEKRARSMSVCVCKFAQNRVSATNIIHHWSSSSSSSVRPLLMKGTNSICRRHRANLVHYTVH